ncbi:hypothetical protein ACWGJB_39520 [Streptomyces sp. NPDC054813]
MTCHQRRHTCLTRMREAGMAPQAVQAHAGHAPPRSSSWSWPRLPRQLQSHV